MLELPLPPSNPPPPSNPLPRPRRHANPQMQEASDPEIDDGYHEWTAREDAKDNAEWQRWLDKEFEE